MMTLIRTALAYLCAVAACLSCSAVAVATAAMLWDRGPLGKAVVVLVAIVDAAACSAVVLDDWLDRSPLRQMRQRVKQQARLPNRQCRLDLNPPRSIARSGRNKP
jgi:hypothetical protein